MVACLGAEPVQRFGGMVNGGDRVMAGKTRGDAEDPTRFLTIPPERDCFASLAGRAAEKPAGLHKGTSQCPAAAPTEGGNFPDGRWCPNTEP